MRTCLACQPAYVHSGRQVSATGASHSQQALQKARAGNANVILNIATQERESTLIVATLDVTVVTLELCRGTVKARCPSRAGRIRMMREPSTCAEQSRPIDSHNIRSLHGTKM